MAITLETAARNAACNAIVDLVDQGSTDATGDLVLRAGSTTLATFTLDATAFGSALDGVAVGAGFPKQANASASGTADNYIIRDRNNATIFGGSVGTSGTDLNLQNTSIGSGQQITLASFSYTFSTPIGDTLLLSAHASGRYIVNAQGTPYLLHGDTAWSAITQLDQTDAAQYLDDCQTRGFNSIIVNLIENEFSADPPENVFGDLPFTGTAFQSSLNADYWDHVDWFIEACAERGIVVLANTAYIGFNDAQGWGAEIAAASQAQVESYATAVGNRLEAHDNIIYSDFGDRLPTGTLLARVNQMRAALLAADTRHTLIAHHYGPDESSHDSEQTWLSFDWIYRYDGFVHEDVLDGYNDATTRPVVFCEGWYELENSSTTLDQRRQAWGSLLSGACGQFYGHRDIWGFGDGLFQVGTWQSALDDTARDDMAHVLAFFSARSWQLLVPDQTSTFITAGRGTITTAAYVTAAFASDDSWGAAYLPTGSTGGPITVARTVFSGAFTPRWFNPRTGAFTSAGGSVPNTGTQQFTAPDSSDWVLVCEVD